MAFQGSLAELHLPDIIQLISVSGKTGVFQLVDGPRQGRIFLHDGQIVHAETEDVSGEEAVYSLAIWRKGDFKFEPGVATEVRTISKSNTNLLMEAARRLDEWRVLSKKIPSTKMIPEFVVQDSREGQINLNTSEWLLLSKIDGHRSIEAIAAACGLSVFDAAKVLYGLIATGLLSVREPAPAATEPGPTSKSPAGTPPTPGKGVARAPTPDGGVARTSTPGGGVARTSTPGGGVARTSTPGGGVARTPTPGGGAAAVGSGPQHRLKRVRDVCYGLLGAVGETVVKKHYEKALAEIEKGGGDEAVEEAINQIARAASILKGPSTTEALLDQLKSIK